MLKSNPRGCSTFVDMPDETEKSALERISEILLAEGVEFIVVGGQAEWLFGSPRATFDVDLCFGGLNIKVIALDDLIKIKQYIRRPKDQESLFQLLAIKKARGEAK